MSAPPPVSVVIPAYNHESYVATAIDSVLGQSFADFELVVVDDASSDGTWDVISGIRDPRLRTVRHAANQGAHASLNEGIAESRGRFIALLNSDDVFRPQRIERLVATAQHVRDRAFFAFTDIEFIDARGVQATESRRASDYLRLREICGALDPALWFLAGNPAVSTSNFFFSRGLFDAIGGFAQLRYTHDWDWAARASARCSPVWMHETLLSYRIHEASTLAEDDVWRHIHENSYVQTAALLRLSDARARCESGATRLDAASRALLVNDSLHPLSLLCFLVCALDGAGNGSMRELVTPRDGQWFLPSLAHACGYPTDLLQSSKRLIGLCKTIADQAAMIDERWNTIQHMGSEIASRDSWIDDLKARLASLQQTVTERDLQIEAMRQDLDETRARLFAAEGELAAMRASRLVRSALFAGRTLRKLGINRMDPRLGED